MVGFHSIQSAFETSVDCFNLKVNTLTSRDAEAMIEVLNAENPLQVLLNSSEHECKMSTLLCDVPVEVTVSDSVMVSAGMGVWIVHDHPSEPFMDVLVPGYGTRRLERSHLSAPVKLVPRKTAARMNFEIWDGDGDFDGYPGLFPMTSVLGRHLASLRIRTEMHARKQTVFDVPAILLACPHLQYLQLRGIRVRDLDCFVDAYEAGDCQVQALSLRSIEVQSTSGVTRFLKAQEDPQHLMTRRLMELELDASCLIQSGSGLESLTTILDRNRTLQVLFVRANMSQRDQANQVLGDYLSLSVYIRRSPMDLRSKLAFLSALNKSSGSLSAVDHMDSGICSLTFAFAAPVIKRLVRVVANRWKTLDRKRTWISTLCGRSWRWLDCRTTM